MSRNPRTHASMRPLPVRRSWLPFAAVTSALSLVLVATVVLGTSTGPELDTPLPPLLPVAEGDATDTEADELTPILLPLAEVELFLSRDPFDPVVPAPEPPPADPADPGDPARPVDPTDPSAPTVPGRPGTGTTTPGDERCVGDTEVVCDGLVLTLEGISTTDGGVRTATIRVGETVYEVAVGGTFAGAFVLASLDGSCAGIVYGDEAFRICLGDQVLK